MDKKNIPWKIGRNKFFLTYNYGIRALGGSYYFDVALFEQTATIPIHYIEKVKNIVVNSDYLGEGRYIIPHEWSDKVYE